MKLNNKLLKYEIKSSIKLIYLYNHFLRIKNRQKQKCKTKLINEKYVKKNCVQSLHTNCKTIELVKAINKILESIYKTSKRSHQHIFFSDT